MKLFKFKNQALFIGALLLSACSSSNPEQKKCVVVSHPDTFHVGGVSFNMINIEGGSFIMGAQYANPALENYDSIATTMESPVHKVEVASFALGETEVTQGLWKAVMKEPLTWNDSVGIGDDYPTYVCSFEKVIDFLAALNDSLHQSGQLATDKNVCLPNENEWEYAAKGGKNNMKTLYSGSNNLDEVGWYELNSGLRAHPVAQKQPNALGIYDMNGNVWEWCSNQKCDYPLTAASEVISKEDKIPHIIRGGSFGYTAHGARNTCRGYNFVWYGDNNIGFRLCIK
ncbi:MAG: formylglycine-generating enzyme family protein [Paludibacteraceae bacterium]|nr:formylglycine-generating enzyme family protein [Paludibacteraceae bacterium]